MCLSFFKLAKPGDKDLLISLINHKLWTVRNAASKKIAQLGNESDLDKLLNLAINNVSNVELIDSIRLLDQKLFTTDNFITAIKLKAQEVSQLSISDDVPF